MLRAGALNRRISLLTATSTTNDIGEQTAASWSVSASVPAQKVTLRAVDHSTAQMFSTTAEAKFLIRWREGVTAKMRVRYEGTDYDIISVEEVDRRRSLSLLVRAG